MSTLHDRLCSGFRDGPLMLSENRRGGSRSAKVTVCLLPREVCILPVAPETRGLLTSHERMPVFQRLQLLGSDETLHTRSGDAVVERNFP